MKNLLVLLMLFPLISFSQFKGKTNKGNIEIGALYSGEEFSISLTKTKNPENRYIFVFRDLKYLNSFEVGGFYFDGDKALDSFYQLLIENLDSKETVVFDTNLGNDFILEIHFNNGNVTFYTEEHKIVAKSDTYNKYQINQLFRKTKN